MVRFEKGCLWPSLKRQEGHLSGLEAKGLEWKEKGVNSNVSDVGVPERILGCNEATRIKLTGDASRGHGSLRGLYVL